MDNKENFGPNFGFDKPTDKVLTNSTKFNIKVGSISSMAS